ncbi:MAG TPA: hypothetical protein VMW41_04155 [Candidatus Bathyarchaeia archaeon]|nr:hypothetical protein [Candidatus Bathyarchaeia archaeon]
MLQSLLVSKVRAKLLQIFLVSPGEMYHVRALVRMAGEEINAVRRELARMESYGMVKKEPRGNRLYYWFNKDFVFYADLLSMIAKSSGLGKEIIKNRNKLGKVKFAMLSGRYVRDIKDDGENRVDLLVVGDIVLPELAKLVREEESKLEREINYTVMDKDEFVFRKKRRDPFILGILFGSRVMVIGDEEEMVQIKSNE